MSWIGITLAVLKLAMMLIQHIKDSKKIDEAEGTILLEVLRNSHERLAKAFAAKQTAVDAHRSSGGVPNESDPNLRD